MFPFQDVYQLYTFMPSLNKDVSGREFINSLFTYELALITVDILLFVFFLGPVCAALAACYSKPTHHSG